ncbi:MAG: peptidylprolyl isomerase [Proteobacteria bacterium]|nr:peptidylprolyl isomerase [Pseudomonadota bacterium]
MTSDFKRRANESARAPNKIAGYFVLIATLLGAAAIPMESIGQQGQVLRIRAIVNDDVISYYDLVQRMRLVLLTGNLENSAETRRRLAPQILRNLIDEKLRLQEAERLNIKISAAQVDQQVGVIEKRNNMPSGGITKVFQDAKIDSHTLRTKLRGELAWRQIVRRRLIRQVNVSNDDVEDEFRRLKSIQHLPQYRMSEIFLSVDSPEQERQVLEVANRLTGQLGAGAKFPLLAREFSQSASAAVGGDLGVVSQGQIDKKFKEVIEKTKTGDIAGPIRTLSGYYILKLHDRVIPSQAAKSSASAIATISQILLPLGPNAIAAEVQAQDRVAQQIRTDTKSCEQLEQTAKTLNTPQSGSLGEVNITTLPSIIQKAVADLTKNQISQPIRVTEGVLVMMICKREENNAALPKKKEIKARLGDQRLNLLMQRYMRDLRRTAYIDLRG